MVTGVTTAMEASVAPDLAWSVAGFVVGYVACASEVYVSRRKHFTTAQNKDRFERLQRRIVPVVLIGIALVMSLILWAQAQVANDQADEQRRAAEQAEKVVRCQTRVNVIVFKVLADRSELSDADRAALANTVQKVLNAESPQESRAALNDFLKELLEQSESTRPELPDIREARCLDR